MLRARRGVMELEPVEFAAVAVAEAVAVDDERAGYVDGRESPTAADPEGDELDPSASLVLQSQRARPSFSAMLSCARWICCALLALLALFVALAARPPHSVDDADGPSIGVASGGLWVRGVLVCSGLRDDALDEGAERWVAEEIGECLGGGLEVMMGPASPSSAARHGAESGQTTGGRGRRGSASDKPLRLPFWVSPLAHPS